MYLNPVGLKKEAEVPCPSLLPEARVGLPARVVAYPVEFIIRITLL
jgi:hypothetical protein